MGESVSRLQTGAGKCMESWYMESHQKGLEMHAQAHIPNSAAVGAGGILRNGLQEVARVVDYF